MNIFKISGIANTRRLTAGGVVSTCMMYIFDLSVRVSRKGIKGDEDGRGVNGDGGS